jgi:hypothetical protein
VHRLGGMSPRSLDETPYSVRNFGDGNVLRTDHF